MGLIIDEAISTSLGATTQAYVNIQEYHINKKDILTLIIRLYTSKNASINNPNIIATHRNINYRVKITLDDANNDASENDIYTFGYNKLKEHLEVHFDNIDDDWDELELEREIID